MKGIGEGDFACIPENLKCPSPGRKTINGEIIIDDISDHNNIKFKNSYGKKILATQRFQKKSNWITIHFHEMRIHLRYLNWNHVLAGKATIEQLKDFRIKVFQLGIFP